MKNINLGDLLTCSVTGKTFKAKRVGFTTNYATNSKGEIFSDEGVFIATQNDIKNREKVSLYISGEVTQGSSVTGWKDDKHGTVYSVISWDRWSYFGKYKMHSVEVRMFDGSLWRGRMSSNGECITLKHIQ